jgi:hypothetical protein
MYKIEKDLELLCIEMIDILGKMKGRGIISEDQYEEHIKLKAEFLNNYGEIYSKEIGQE